jgi:predicted acylesterase/phospholipase RssA
MSIKLQIAFQGGGAKLAALLAVVEEIQTLQRSSEIIVTRVSGTSAGAIAAALLAFDIDAGAIAQSLSANGSDYIERVIPASRYPRAQGLIPKLKMYKNVIQSRPIANIQALREIIEELLSQKFNEEELSIKIPLFVVAADLRKGEKRTIEITEFGGPLFDALVDSCALPIFFRTSKHLAGSSLVDGGLLENLPVTELIDDEATFGEAIAVSFEENSNQFLADNFLQYSFGLLNAAILNSCKRATQLAGKHKVLMVKTDIDTFDFEKAINILPSSDQYISIRKDAHDWLVSTIQLLRSNSSQMKLNDVLIKNFQIYKSHYFHRKKRVERGALMVTARCLAYESENVYSIYDEISWILKFSPVDQKIYCIAISSEENEDGSPVFIPDVSVIDSKGYKVDVLLLPAIDPDLRIAPNGAKMKDLLIYFPRPLDPADEEYMPYTITKNEIVRQCMQPLKKQGHDYLLMRNSHQEPIQNAELLLRVPINFPQVIATSQNNAPNFRTDFREMKDTELVSYGIEPGGFRTVGWKVENLLQGESFGLDLILKR